MGVILVLIALVVGIFLLVKGGGDDAASTNPDRPAAGETPSEASTTTTAPPVTVPVAQLEVIVANGSGVAGRAKRTAELLKGAGYATVSFVDGNTTTVSQVFFIGEAQADAAGVAAALNLPADRVVPMPQAVPLNDSQMGTSKVLVLVGPDFDPASPPPPPAPAPAPAPTAGG